MSLIIGAHMSIGESIAQAMQDSASIGGNALQIFAKNPKSWNLGFKKLKSQQIREIHETQKKYSQICGIIHSSFLINLAQEGTYNLLDINSVIDDLKIAHQIGFYGVVVHIGKRGELDIQFALDNVINNVIKIIGKTSNLNIKLILENTTGQGTEIGWKLEEMNYILNKLNLYLNNNNLKYSIGICRDTAHAWGASYDISNWDTYFSEIGNKIGFENILMFHLNDSKAILGSKSDRHANIGRGFIGLKNFIPLINYANGKNIPVIIETPEDKLRVEEIELIKNISENKLSENEINNFHQTYFHTQYLKKYSKYITNS